MGVCNVVNVCPVEQIIIVSDLEVGLARTQNLDEARQCLPIANAKEACSTQSHSFQLARLGTVGLKDDLLCLSLWM